MGAVTTSLGEQAQSIFDDLGYTVSRIGTELRAEYKWRVVRISVLDPDETPPESGTLRCFVTHSSDVGSVYTRLVRTDLEYDWAVLGIDDDGEYDVFLSDSAPTV